MLLYDNENDFIVTLEQLKKEYSIAKRFNYTESESFEDYFKNCLTRYNGTLDIMNSDTINFVHCTMFGNDNISMDTDTAQYNIECWKKEGISIPKQLDKWNYTALYNYFIEH